MKFTIASELKKDASAITDMSIGVDLGKLVRGMADDEQAEVARTIVEEMAASNFLESLEDHAATPIKKTAQLTDRGTILMDIFVKRAEKLGRLPESWEPDWVAAFRADLDRLQEMIVERRTSDALDLLRELAPDHQFLSPAAQHMLAAQRSLL